MGNQLMYEKRVRKFRQHISEDCTSTPEMSDLIAAIVWDTYRSESFETADACQRVADEVTYTLWAASGGLWMCHFSKCKTNFNVKPRPRNFVKFDIAGSRHGYLEVLVFQQLTPDQFHPVFDCTNPPNQALSPNTLNEQ